MSPLGRFGGSEVPVRGVSQGTGADPIGDFIQSARDGRIPSPEGEPASSAQIARETAGYSLNLLINGSFESWSSGTSSAPDGWTLTGAGGTVARNTTASQLQFGRASLNLTAALNTVTYVSQAITISTTQNLRLRGRRVTLSCRVRSATASRALLVLSDGVTTKESTLHSGDSTFQTLVVSLTLDAAATTLEVRLEINSGASITATFDGAKLEEGAEATAFTENPRDTFVQPRNVNSALEVTTTSTTAVLLDSMSIANVIVDGTQSVLLFFAVQAQNNTANQAVFFQLTKDGGVSFIGNTSSDIVAVTANTNHNGAMSVIDVKPAASTYTYEVYWGVGANTGKAVRRSFSLAVIPSA